jgi:hypothetical protein
MKRFIIAQSDKEFYTSHSGLALVGLCVNKLCSLPAKPMGAFPVSAGNNGIGLDDILRSYIGLLATGQSDYEAVSNRREGEYFRRAPGIGKRPMVDSCSVEFLKQAGVTFTSLATGHVPLDAMCLPWTAPRPTPRRRESPAFTVVRTAMPLWGLSWQRGVVS